MIGVLFVLSILRPIQQADRKLTIHRNLCVYSVLLLVTVIIFHLAPFIYIILNRLSPPPSHKALGIVATCRMLAIFAALLIIGSMRRGPRLRYDPMKLGTSFGINADPSNPILNRSEDQEDEAESLLKGEKVEDMSNVLDYRNSAVINFMLLTYVRNGSIHTFS